MHHNCNFNRVLVPVVALLALSACASKGTFMDRVRDTAEQAAARETLAEVDLQVTNAVRCTFDNLECIERAKADGKTVEVVDDDGEVVETIEGDGGAALEVASGDANAMRPGEGAWANYDFVPGEVILFYDDFSSDNVGDFPRRLEFVSGNWEVVEWQGRRLLRNTGPRGAAFRILLPETLPERFTIETEVYFPHGNQQLALFVTDGSADPGLGNYTGQYLQIAGNHGTGVLGRGEGTVESTNDAPKIHEELVPIRFMIDGTYLKAYVGERRVANAPNVELPRTAVLHIENVYFADQENPMLIGPIRVAAGGRDLYDALESEGRVATQGILFDTGSDRIRPESSPTLEEIGTMLAEHPDLRLTIEGHTDNVGEDATNQTLSEQRAAAVRDYLVATYGIDAARLTAAGFGESNPVASNDTPEGRQQNRRVELVRM